MFRKMVDDWKIEEQDLQARIDEMSIVDQSEMTEEFGKF